MCAMDLTEWIFAELDVLSRRDLESVLLNKFSLEKKIVKNAFLT